MRIPRVQKDITDVATRELTQRLGVPVRIQHVDLKWLNKVVLDGVYLEDQKGKTLFEANHITAGLDLWPLLQGRLVFTTARIFGFTFNLEKETDHSPLNLQFVIDAFARRDTVKRASDIELRFNTILIRRGNFNFNVADAPNRAPKFDAKHTAVEDINATISIRTFSKDSINASIRRLSLKEKSGIQLDKLSLEIIGNRDGVAINQLNVRLPKTNFLIPKALIDLRQVTNTDDFINRAPIQLNIAPSLICLQDLSAFVPAFRNFTDTLEFSATATGEINNIDVESFTLRLEDKLQVTGKTILNNIVHPQEAYLFGEVSEMSLESEGIPILVDNFTEKDIRLPQTLHRAGTIHFTGEISGAFNNLIAFGTLSSDIGTIHMNLNLGRKRPQDIALFLKGNITSNGFGVQRLLPKEVSLGDIDFNINFDTQRRFGGSLFGQIDAQLKEIDYNGYRYEDLNLLGYFQKNAFDGTIEIDDPNVHLLARGLFMNQRDSSQFNFRAKLEHFRPDILRLTDRYESPEIGLTLLADFTGNHIDNVNGRIQIDSLSFKSAPSDLFIDHLEIDASGEEYDRQLTVKSDFLNGELSGSYSFSTIAPSLLNTLKVYVPALVKKASKEPVTKANNFAFLFTIENTETLSNTLKLPFTVLETSRITGHYNNIYNKFRIEAWLPKFKAGKSLFDSGYLHCDNPADQIDLRLRAVLNGKKGGRNRLELTTHAKENQMGSTIHWSNNLERRFSADLSASALFSQIMEEDKAIPRTEITLHESPLVINDSLWMVNPSRIAIQEGRVAIDQFKISRDERHLFLNGLVSKNPEDSLEMDMNRIELGHLFDILDIPSVRFSGEATGKVYLNDLFNSRRLNTNLEVEQFAFNGTTLGRLDLFSEWDDQQKGISMIGNIYENDSTWSDVRGYIYPVGPNAGLSLHFGANDIDLSFLRPFVEKVISNLSGRGYGNVHLFGPFKQLNVEGRAFVKEGGLGVDYLNTYYTFSDSIFLDPGAVRLRNVEIKDKFGNSGRVNLDFNHQHFKNFNFLVSLQANNMLMYDITRRQNPLIYGTVFGSGSATIQGNSRLVDFDISVRNEPNTAVYLDFIKNNSAADYDFITFIDRDAPPVAPTDSLQETTVEAETPGEAELRMNFALDITPDANIELIMDPIAGDRIKGTASGSLQIQYGNHSDLRMFGDVNIVEGNYNFSLQQIIRKEFTIQEGSTIQFRGDPLNAHMNINAAYNLTANLSDLDESIARESARSSVPVNCLLNLEGALRSPSVTFDLQLPGSNEEIERQVKSVVSTEDMMSRQIVYLLVLGKFYTPDYTMATRSNELNAVASSAISTQLSSLLNSITDKVQIGTNIRAGQTGFADQTTEYEMLLSSQLLDNRLLINGNFGMRNNSYMAKNVFVGEFDLEYKLTRSGDLRLKAYNHANDMYMTLKNALTTQGIGILYKKDFTHLSEIFGRRKKRIQPNMDSIRVFSTPADTLQTPPMVEFRNANAPR